MDTRPALQQDLLVHDSLTPEQEQVSVGSSAHIGFYSKWEGLAQTAKRIGAIVLATVGPGSFVAVGYMDPGNWATDLQAGAQFNYAMQFVVLLSGLIAIALQSLTIRLGVATGLDLPQMCRKEFHPVANFILWILAEVAIISTDLAEVIGAAIAIKLLFGLPISYGVLVMGLDVLVVLFGWNQKRLRYFEMFIFILILGVGICFMILLPRVGVNWGDALLGYLPSLTLVKDSNAVFSCLGILGATVMPHNLYLHSSLVQFKSPMHLERLAASKLSGSKSNAGHDQPPLDPISQSTTATPFETVPFVVSPPTNRAESIDTIIELAAPTIPSTIPNSDPAPIGSQPSSTTLFSMRSRTPPPPARTLPSHYQSLIKKCIQHLNVDSTLSLLYATLVNSSILITAAAAFYDPLLGDSNQAVTGIQDAYDLLHQNLGKGVATVFAVGLFFSGQCSTVTGTLAGQVVMEGFLGGVDTLDAVDGEEFLVADKLGRSGPTGRLDASVDAQVGANKGAVHSFTQPMVAFFKRRMWARRLVTRGIAIVPALVVTATQGDAGVDNLLVLSQVVLGVLLPFAVWPLVYFTSSRRVMTVQYVDADATREEGAIAVQYSNSWLFATLVYLIAVAVTGLNIYLVISSL
ncbi:hypothetical protein HDU98_007068 [Podochytrium sp. JEL0797]|nr:hypothetical protein HDU98_007068 [Podochytrium sp. JEL0797]